MVGGPSSGGARSMPRGPAQAQTLVWLSAPLPGMAPSSSQSLSRWHRGSPHYPSPAQRVGAWNCILPPSPGCEGVQLSAGAGAQTPWPPPTTAPSTLSTSICQGPSAFSQAPGEETRLSPASCGGAGTGLLLLQSIHFSRLPRAWGRGSLGCPWLCHLSPLLPGARTAPADLAWPLLLPTSLRMGVPSPCPPPRLRAWR